MKLANSISGAFLEWLERGGHKLTIKKHLLVVVKASIHGDLIPNIYIDRNEYSKISSAVSNQS